MSLEVEIGGKDYRIGKLDAFRQMHLARRIAPLVPKVVAILPLIAGIAGRSKEDLLIALASPDSGLLSQSSAALAPLADTLASMPDDHVEYIMGCALSVVHRRNQHGWAAVWNEKARACMFDDIGLDVMMRLVIHVVRENLGNFISGLLSSSDATGQTAANG